MSLLPPPQGPGDSVTQTVLAKIKLSHLGTPPGESIKAAVSPGERQEGALGSRNQEMEGPVCLEAQLPGRAGDGQQGLGGREARSSPSSAPLRPRDLRQAALEASGSSPMKRRHHHAPCRAAAVKVSLRTEGGRSVTTSLALPCLSPARGSQDCGHLQCGRVTALVPVLSWAERPAQGSL